MNSRNSHISPQTQFKILAENVCALIQEEGTVFRPFANSALPYFSQLPIDKQQHTVSLLQDYFDICLKAKATPEGPGDSRNLTICALEHFGFAIDPEVVERIAANDLVQLYAHNQLQIFRSFRFFEISSYTLEDVLCRKWYHIFERDPEIQARLEKLIAEFLKAPSLSAVDLPAHIVREKDTLERLSIHTKISCWAPLYKTADRVAGMIVIENSNFTV